ncbi:MAG TPA: efflux RND transporter periplasmic adaptor subunit [bacterium]|nr:efflux RND transporter periplasmic adaptor subunit [bacterium]
MKRRWVYAAVAVVAVGSLGAWRLWRDGNGGLGYNVAAVGKGLVVQTVKATGTVQPIKQVEVGTQVTGRISKLYVDFNSEVREGQTVAQIDPTVYEARVAQDQANVVRSRADVQQVKAQLWKAEKELARDRQLLPRNLISLSELDADVASRDVLVAQLKQSRAAVDQAQAQLRLSQADLSYTVIKSPVNGVVVARNVSEGQTVVASLAAATIFVIATDLSHVQVEAAIPEADIGKAADGQPVSFTVDAFPDQTFHGEVTQVRINATTVQNVVTYTVIITAENPERKLLPGMTANVSVEVARHEDVLKVPNAALRFRPAAQGEAAGVPWAGAGEQGRSVEHGHKIYVLADKGLSEVRVTTGISDGSFTEVSGPGLTAGQQVVVGMVEAGEGNQQVNPFMPQMPSRNVRRVAH